jgi:hypothetical protein
MKTDGKMIESANENWVERELQKCEDIAKKVREDSNSGKNNADF